MRRYLPVFLIAGLVAVAFTCGLVATARSTTRALDTNARLEQYNRGHDVASRLDDYLELSEQVADTTATIAAPVRDAQEVESLIREVLTSTDPNFVYGVGVWFAPYRFDPAQQYFGPYAHRSPRGIVVTYEWSTPEYDYPSHPWYQLGLRTGARPAFTDPYFDVDHVYMTTGRAMFDAENNEIGVVSVDLILPQLREIVARANASLAEEVYVATGSGHLFAHPDELRLVDWARAKGRPVAHLTDLTVDDVKAFDAEQHRDLVEQTVSVDRSGWRVHVASDRTALFVESSRVRGTAAVVAMLGWVVCGAAAVAFVRRRQAQELSREVEAHKHVESELRGGLEARDEFLGVVSHELKTPITALSLRLQAAKMLAERGKPVDERQLGFALHQTDRLRLLVEEMLDVARLARPQMPLELAPIPIAPVVHAAISAVAPMSAGQRVVVSMPAEELIVKADAKRLEQVVSNLISNAIKYTPNERMISIVLERRGNEAVLCVRDEGIGIPADQLAHVFERYFRGRNAPTTSYSGLGLGLYISREIILRHGGRMWVESTTGKGSAFYVALPIVEPTRESAAVPATSVG